MDIPQEVFWVVLGIVLFIIEGTGLTLVTIWFAFGAVVAYILALIGLPFIVQVISFLAVSAILLKYTKPIAKKYLNVMDVKTNSDRIIGQEAEVIEEIDEVQGKGQIKVMGQIWTARSKSKKNISKGSKVIVTEIKGVRAIVKEEE